MLDEPQGLKLRRPHIFDNRIRFSQKKVIFILFLLAILLTMFLGSALNTYGGDFSMTT